MKRSDFRKIKQDYFSFTSSERRGIVVLLCLMVLVFIADKLIFYFEKPREADEELFNTMLAQTGNTPDLVKPQSLFTFNPNTIDSLALDSLMLPPQIKRNLLRYRRAGGRFKTPDDFRKMYGMTDSIFTIINDYIKVLESPIVEKEKIIHETERFAIPEKEDTVPAIIEQKVVSKIELNHATAEELLKLYGIGEVLSERIIKYRDLLGGFYSIDQLKEVYGLRAETFELVKDKLTVDISGITTLNVNFAEVRELMRHPYIEMSEAKNIIAYREKNGFIEDISILKRDSVLSEDSFNKVKPYLKSR